MYYRDPAYLLTTGRSQSEVNHREAADTLGVGQAQVWNSTAVPKQPVLTVAAYAQLPKWRRNARRPSSLDLITLLRKEMTQQPAWLTPFGSQTTDSTLVRAAAA